MWGVGRFMCHSSAPIPGKQAQRHTFVGMQRHILQVFMFWYHVKHHSPLFINLLTNQVFKLCFCSVSETKPTVLYSQNALWALTLAFLRTCPRTGEGFWPPCCRRSSEALLTGREQDSVSLVSQLEKGEDSWVRRNIAGDYKHTDGEKIRWVVVACS